MSIVNDTAELLAQSIALWPGANVAMIIYFIVRKNRNSIKESDALAKLRENKYI